MCSRTAGCLALALVAAQALAQQPGTEGRPGRPWLDASGTPGLPWPLAEPWRAGPGWTARWYDHIEASVTWQDMRFAGAGPATGQAGPRMKMDLLSLKARWASAIGPDSDDTLPQVAVGIAHRSLDAAGLTGALDAEGADRRGVDAYLRATQRLSGFGRALHGSLRLSRAQGAEAWGLGGAGPHPYRLQAALSADWAWPPTLAVGAELRFRPLNGASQGAGPTGGGWQGLHLAWTPSRQVSVTATWMAPGPQAAGGAEPHPHGLLLTARITP